MGGGGVFISSGTFSMEGNASVLNNITNNPYRWENMRTRGGGVYLANGTFTMRDNASVSGNSNAGWGANSHGGGVLIANGTFTMQDRAWISRNTVANGDGGGVHIAGGAFTMQGNAVISGNSASQGGGVCVADGTFTKTGGTLAGNDVPADQRNTASGLGSAIHAASNRYRNATAGVTINTASPSFWAND